MNRWFALAHCTVEFFSGGSLVTFSDGKSTQSWPHPEDHHYHVVAHRLGYGDDLTAFCQEHDAMHCIAWDRLYRQPSPVLWAIAHGDTSLSDAACACEEIIVQTLQRWVRANERPLVAGVDWDALKAQTLCLLGDRP